MIMIWATFFRLRGSSLIYGTRGCHKWYQGVP